MFMGSSLAQARYQEVQTPAGTRFIPTKETQRSRITSRTVSGTPCSCAATIDPGPVALRISLKTGPGRNWARLWKPLIDAFGPVLGEDPTRPFHPHDDRIVSLGLRHTVDTGIAHDVIIDARWTRL
jgi:hypothetical protein